MNLARATRAVAARAATGVHRRRIALVLSHLWHGGAERVAASLASRWSGAGYHVSLVTMSARNGDVVGLPAEVERVALDLLRPSRNPLDGAAMASRRVFALRKALLGLSPDVVVSFLDRTNVLTLLATWDGSVPVFVCERSDPRHAPLGRPWSALRRLLYPRAAGVVVQTERVAAWARRFCSRVHVIPNFIEPPPCVATPGAEEGPKKLLGVGRLSPEKGFDLLIEAFARIAPAHPDWSLTVLGEGPERQRLEALVCARHLEGRVSLPGSVADPRLHLAAAHAFALSSRYEGFPNALLEAMACGLPVAAFDCESGPGEIVTHERDGLLVPAGDVARLAAALDHLAASAAERARLGCNARGIAVSLAPDVVLARWSALLRLEDSR